MKILVGDYVLATKYRDGCSGDAWCVGFVKDFSLKNNRYYVADINGNEFYSAGYRKVKKISSEYGKFLIDNMHDIEECKINLWGKKIKDLFKGMIK